MKQLTFCAASIPILEKFSICSQTRCRASICIKVSGTLDRSSVLTIVPSSSLRGELMWWAVSGFLGFYSRFSTFSLNSSYKHSPLFNLSSSCYFIFSFLHFMSSFTSFTVRNNSFVCRTTDEIHTVFKKVSNVLRDGSTRTFINGFPK